MTSQFKETWVVDFEFHEPPGHRPHPLTMCALEIVTGRKIRLWRDEFPKVAPIDTGRDTLFIAHSAAAELSCFKALGWEMPRNVLCTFTETRALTNGLLAVKDAGLAAIMKHLGLPSMDQALKDIHRRRAIAGGPYSARQKTELISYCADDVDAEALLFKTLLPRIDLELALYRGRFHACVAEMEWAGIPVDVGAYRRLERNWDAVLDRLVAEVSATHPVFKGRGIDKPAFERWQIAHGIAGWPRTEVRGDISLDKEVTKKMMELYPEVIPIVETHRAVTSLRLHDLAIGPDNRNRTGLVPYGAISARNTPSSSRSIFGPSVWVRSYIWPPPGRVLIYSDFEQQEFGIAAVLSGDRNMLAAYGSGDVYLAFGKQAGVIPANGSKETHSRERAIFKTVVLAVQYGQGHKALAARLGVSEQRGLELLSFHKRVYSRFWEWSEYLTANAQRPELFLQTPFGWPLFLAPGYKENTVKNFPMQATGADILRLACEKVIRAGVQIDFPVHDALLCEATEGDAEDAIATIERLMTEAGAAVLGGFPLRIETKIVRHPDHYHDDRGEFMEKKIGEILTAIHPPMERADGACEASGA